MDSPKDQDFVLVEGHTVAVPNHWFDRLFVFDGIVLVGVEVEVPEVVEPLLFRLPPKEVDLVLEVECYTAAESGDGGCLVC